MDINNSFELETKNKINSNDTIKIEPFRKNIRKTLPHKHNKYLEFVYFSKAEGYHVIDSLKIDINAPIFFVIRKEQVHFWNLKSEPTGFVIIVKESFIDQCLDIDLKQLLIQISAFPYLHPKDSQTIEKLFNLLINEVPENIHITEGLFKALLCKVMQSKKIEKSTRGKLYYEFIELLSRQKTLLNNVENYANLLNTTPQNLSINCRIESGKSASEILSNYILSEAKRLLLYSNKNISEIAYSLSFKDNSHFTKYFKRHVGITPSNYKKGI